MNKEFIPYEQALALKELGFDEPCLVYHDNFNIFIIDRNSKIEHKNSIYSNNELYKGVILSPLYQQAFRWFREKYNLKSWIQEHTADTFIYEIRPHVLTHYKEGETYIYDSYEEAELECLKKLIEIVK